MNLAIKIIELTQAQPLSIQIEKGVLSGEKLENDLQRILKPAKL